MRMSGAARPLAVVGAVLLVVAGALVWHFRHPLFRSLTDDPAPPAPSTVQTTSAPPPAFPGPADTGVPAGTALTASGGLTVTTSGAVLDGLDIHGTVTVKAAGVTIRNSRLTGPGQWGITVVSGDVRIERVEITGFGTGISGSHWSATGVDIHDIAGDGVKFGSGVTLARSWIHNLHSAATDHADGGQMQTGVTDLAITGNTIDVSADPQANSALFLAPDLGPNSAGPVRIAGNYLDGGNYTVYCLDGADGRYRVGGISFTDNVFGPAHRYGPVDRTVPVTQSGNTLLASGQPLTL